MYVVNHQPDQTVTARWQDYQHYPNYQPSTAVRRWLLDRGSLTRHLQRQSCGHFAVQVLSQGWQRPTGDEARLLQRPLREQAIIREVLLRCFGQPWVFARSVIPASSLDGRLRQLRYLSNRPLGQLLFNDPQMERDPFQLALIGPRSRYLHSAVAVTGSVWGRRSRFVIAGKPLLVAEVFLPDFKPWT